VTYFQGFRPGSRVQGQMINTGFNAKNKPQIMIGKLAGIDIDRKNKQFRVFIRDTNTNTIHEVYAHTLSPLSESAVKTFDAFLIG